MEKVKESIPDFMVDDPEKKLILIIERQQFSRTKCYSFLCLLGFFLQIICMKFISAMLLLQKEEIVKLVLFAQLQKLSECSSYLPLSCNLWRIATVLYMYVEFLYFIMPIKKQGQAKGLRYSQKSLLPFLCVQRMIPVEFHLARSSVLFCCRLR